MIETCLPDIGKKWANPKKRKEKKTEFKNWTMKKESSADGKKKISRKVIMGDVTALVGPDSFLIDTAYTYIPALPGITVVFHLVILSLPF